jgi:phosphoadenosine phosphosulfate reductase
MSAGLLDHLADLERAFGHLDGLALLRAVLREGPLSERTALVSSFGAESIVLLDMVASIDPRTPVLFLDTGKLFELTRQYRERVTDLLGLRDVRVLRPEPEARRRLDPESDLWRRAPDDCCELRKTAPLERGLDGFAAWVTGRKRFQGGLRVTLPRIEGDARTGRIKLNPLAMWSAEDLEHYRRLRDLPVHPLVERGYRSIGCRPCTRPIGTGEPARAGRWSGLDKTECGIHGRGQGA